MTEQRTSVGTVRRGVPAAVALSAAFVVLLILTPLLIAAVVTLLAAATVGAVRTRAVARTTAHTLVQPTFPTAAVIVAPRAANAGGRTTAAA